MRLRSKLLPAVVFVAAVSPLRGQPDPAWIWSGDDSAAPRVFRTDFRVEPGTRAVDLKITSDFASLDLFIGDQPIRSIEAYDPVTTIELSHLSGEGDHQLTIVATPVEGPSAIAATLTHRLANAGSVSSSLDPDSAGGNGYSKGIVLPARWAPNHLPEVSPSAEYNQWKEALDDPSAKTLSPLPPGFTLTKLRDAGEEEDSWVSLAIDPKGRLLIAQEQKGLLRFTLSDHNAEIVGVERINDTLEECRGLAFRGGVLYVNANDSKALYRLRDTTGDDLYDEVTLIQETTGSVGHGRNDLTVGPDGAIHAIHGDSVDSPDRTWFLTAPEDPQARPLGHWLTIGQDDNQWTLLARGLRNPYGIDFNRDGEAFTYDADNEGDVGLPFYRPSRINHLVVGANYGWWQRPGNTRSLPVYAPDSVPTTFDVGRGSPTGVKFGTGSNFGAPWDEALFALDWAYGRIVAMHPVPRGASYYASGEVFLEGRPLNVTDLDFDEDGAMIFTTGGRKTKSALYRLSYDPDATGKQAGEPEPGLQAREREAYSAMQRALRRQVALATDQLAADDPAWSLLGSADPWLRNAARVRIERRPVSEWRGSVTRTGEGLARLTALLALARQGDPEDKLVAITSASLLASEGWNRTEKLTFLRICELSWSKKVPGATNQDIARRALDWIGQPDAPVTREAVRVLALMDHPETVSRAQLLLTGSATQSDRLFYLEMLSRVSTGWEDDGRTSFFKSLAIARDTSRGDRFMPPFFEELQENALNSAPETERTRLAGLLAPPETETEVPVVVREFVRNWSMTDFESTDFEASSPLSDEEGLALYRAGLCHKCHTFGAEGMPVGPDLTTVGSRFSPEDLLLSILEPSAVVSEVYRNVTADLTAGTAVTGRLMRDDFRKSTLYLSTNPFVPHEMIEIPKANIESLSESEVSPMPPALLSGFTKKEVIGLIQWMRRKNPN